MRKHAAKRIAIIAVLKEVQKEAGISAKALSLKLGEASTYFHEIQHGQHRVRLEEFLAICEALEADPGKVIERIRRYK